MTNLTYDKDTSSLRIEKEVRYGNYTFKYYAIHDYYGKNKFTDVDSDILYVRNQIYSFKGGRNSDLIARKFIYGINEKGLSLNNTCVMIIPASDPIESRNRFQRFASYIATGLNIQNAWLAITTVAHAPTKGKVGGNKIEFYTFNSVLYAGKNVFLFDDITTSGTVFEQVSLKLMNTGALSVTGFFLGKTVSTYNTQYLQDFMDEEDSEQEFDGLIDYDEPPDEEEPDWW